MLLLHYKVFSPIILLLFPLRHQRLSQHPILELPKDTVFP